MVLFIIPAHIKGDYVNCRMKILKSKFEPEFNVKIVIT